MIEDGNEGGAYSTAMAEDGDSALPKKHDTSGTGERVADGEIELDEDEESGGDDGVPGKGAPPRGAADEQATKTGQSF